MKKWVIFLKIFLKINYFNIVEVDHDPSANLYFSQMNTTGQLNADLALSDDSDEDEGLSMAKRPKLDDLDTM